MPPLPLQRCSTLFQPGFACGGVDEVFCWQARSPWDRGVGVLLHAEVVGPWGEWDAALQTERFPDLLGLLAPVRGSAGAPVAAASPRAMSSLRAQTQPPQRGHRSGGLPSVGVGCPPLAGEPGRSPALVRGGGCSSTTKPLTRGRSFCSGWVQAAPQSARGDGGGLSSTALGLSSTSCGPACTYGPVHQFCWVF